MRRTLRPARRTSRCLLVQCERCPGPGGLNEVSALRTARPRGHLLRESSLRAQALQRACKPVAGTELSGSGGAVYAHGGSFALGTPCAIVKSRFSCSSSNFNARNFRRSSLSVVELSLLTGEKGSSSRPGIPRMRSRKLSVIVTSACAVGRSSSASVAEFCHTASGRRFHKPIGHLRRVLRAPCGALPSRCGSSAVGDGSLT